MARFSRWHRLALCAVVAGALYIPALGAPALWEPDEGRYAEIAREMVQSGDYITPRNDWVRYFEKPPLMYWATAGAIELLGPSEFAARLPAALFSVAEVVVTCALAESMFGASAGLLAATALGLSPLVFGFARFLTLDPALAFFVTAALGAFYAAARSDDFGQDGGRRWLVASATMVAMGTLTKGPVALVICCAVALIYLLLEARLRELKRIPWMACALVYGLITLPWFVIVARRNPEFLGYFFVHEHLQRYLASTEHAWGPWLLIAVAAGGTWPWLYFAPPGVIELRRDTGERRSQNLSALRFLAVWFLFVLVFFSIPRSKLGSYVLPAIPPLSILAGCGLLRLGEPDSRRIGKLMGGFAMLNLIVAGACTGALVMAAQRLGRALVVDGMAAAASLAIGAIASFVIGARAGRFWAAAAIALGVAAAMGAAVRARDDAAPMVSYRNLARAIAPYLEPGCVLASYRHQIQSLPFYTGRREAMVNYLGELGAERESPDAAKSFLDQEALATLWGSSTCVVMVLNREDSVALIPALKPEPALIACEGKKIALFNRPAKGPAMDYDCRRQPGRQAGAAMAGLGLDQRHL